MLGVRRGLAGKRPERGGDSPKNGWGRRGEVPLVPEDTQIRGKLVGGVADGREL